MIQFELDTDRALFEGAFEFAQQQVRRLIEKHPDFYPMYTEKGRWKHRKPAWTHWCDGFLPGMMWLFHRRSEGANADYWKRQAIRYTEPLEDRKFDRDVHDLGFIFMSTYRRWFALTQDPLLNDVLIQAGQTLALRFKEKGQYLRSFVSDESLFIDIMMNVGIIFYAARETGDRRLREIAMRHSLTTRRYLVRGDGSTSHEGIFDLKTGEFQRQTTHQGFRGDSCWARGLTWAIYGFGTCYEYARDPNFLATAEACADYYITYAPANGIPPWDFNAPAASRKQVDTSAAAIGAAGLLRLSRLVQDPVKGHFYWASGHRIMRSLCESHLAKGNPNWEGILTGGVYHIHKKLGVNESVMWGEHFFVEALEHLLSPR
ncbi:MAG: glucuronyl hydrolase [Acidobacteria bacterium]|nr:glucuronyl hydrolase [Acidobacteriota bacterium]